MPQSDLGYFIFEDKDALFKAMNALEGLNFLKTQASFNPAVEIGAFFILRRERKK